MADTSANLDEKKREETFINQPDVERVSLSVAQGDLLSQEHVDPVLNAKMHLVNDVRQLKPCAKRRVLNFPGH